MTIPREPMPEGAHNENRAARRARKHARNRRERRLDWALLAFALITALVLGLSLHAHQRKLQRVTSELVALKAQAPAMAQMAKLDSGALSAPRGQSKALAHSIPGIQEAALEAGECPKAASAQLAFKRQFLAPIHYWSQTELKDLRSQRVAYLFSGPDVATAATLFGATDHLIMVADQWVEHIQDTASTDARLHSECKTLAHYSRFGYFRTHDLEGRGGTRPRFLHLLMHNILLADLSIEGAQYLQINDQGQAQPVSLDAGRKAAGVRFHVRRHDGSQALIDYMRVDLSDPYLKRSPAELAFLKQSLSDVVLLKSASHLLQEPMFSVTAGLVSQHARFLVQDETGMPINALQENFELRVFGDFADAHRLWTGKAEARELKAFRASIKDPKPLYFTFGYEKPVGSIILVGTRRKGDIRVAQSR